MTARSQGAGRQCILDQAQGLFLAHGYHGVSIRDIVRACGLSNAALYYHFGSKQNLFVEVFKHYVAENMHELQAAGTGGGVCRERLASMAEAHTRFMLTSQSELHLLFHDLMKFDRNDIRKLVHDTAEKVPSKFATVLKEGIASGEVRSVDAERVSRLLLGMLRSLGGQCSYDSVSETLKEDIELAVGILFDGIGTR